MTLNSVLAFFDNNSVIICILINVCGRNIQRIHHKTGRTKMQRSIWWLHWLLKLRHRRSVDSAACLLTDGLGVHWSLLSSLSTQLITFLLAWLFCCCFCCFTC